MPEWRKLSVGLLSYELVNIEQPGQLDNFMLVEDIRLLQLLKSQQNRKLERKRKSTGYNGSSHRTLLGLFCWGWAKYCFKPYVMDGRMGQELELSSANPCGYTLRASGK